MDVSADKYKSEGSRAGPLIAVSQTVRGIFRWLVGFFHITEEDRSKAGIYFGGGWRD